MCRDVAVGRLMVHHQDVAVQSAKVIFRDVLGLADSLRSVVTKNALVAVSEVTLDTPLLY